MIRVFYIIMRKLVLMMTVVMVITLVFPFANAENVPDWVKNTAGWWATDAISETEFVNAIEFLVKDEIIQVASTSSGISSESVPDWVKNTAGWWATDAISETEFVNAIEFLVNVGIINIEGENNCVNDLLKYFNDKEEIIDVCNEHESVIHEELIPYDVELKFNSKGFRGEEFSEEKPSDVFRIFMVGGSTMLGAETTNDTTIPSIVQKMYEQEKLDREIEIINVGISGGNTLTELELIKSKIINYDPDLIMIYDGWNDISADYPVPGIVNKWEQVCALAYNEKFDVIITLQPIAGFGNKSLTIQEKINSLTGEDHSGFQLIQAKSTYEWLAKQMQILGLDAEMQLGKGVCETYDLRSIFDDVNGAIYWDQGHVLHAGNFIVAEKFFELSMKKIDSSFESEQKFTQIISKYNSIPIISYLLSEIGISEETFQNELRNISKLETADGKFFELEEKFDNSSDIFVGKDLSETDLNNINFVGHDLTGADLSGQDLRNIDLSETIIRDSDLSNTDLQGVDMSGMDLRGINFSNANLKDVNFTDAVFSKLYKLQEENVLMKTQLSML